MPDLTPGQIAYAAWRGISHEHLAGEDWPADDRNVKKWEAVGAAVVAAAATPSEFAWTPDRIAELVELQNMVRDLKTINNGSSFLETIAACIKRATAVDALDIDRNRHGLVSWLIAMANADRERRKAR